jgi:hypothetical protein
VAEGRCAPEWSCTVRIKNVADHCTRAIERSYSGTGIRVADIAIEQATDAVTVQPITHASTIAISGVAGEVTTTSLATYTMQGVPISRIVGKKTVGTWRRSGVETVYPADVRPGSNTAEHAAVSTNIYSIRNGAVQRNYILDQRILA